MGEASGEEDSRLGGDDKSIFLQKDMQAFSLDFRYSVTAPAIVAIGAISLYMAMIGVL